MNLKKKYLKSWGKVGSFCRCVYWVGNKVIADFVIIGIDKIRNLLVANSIEDGGTKRMLRNVQMCIHEYLVNHILNKSETILTSFLSVM